MSTQVHDSYGKRLLKAVVGERFVPRGRETRVDFGGVTGSIDGVVKDCCAVEIESRVAKQVRGALVDLLEHHLSKKLLVLIPVHMYNAEAKAKHCKYILEKYASKGAVVKVVLLKGTGKAPRDSEDKQLLRQALEELGCISRPS
jgi:hypothetical protein